MGSAGLVSNLTINWKLAKEYFMWQKSSWLRIEDDDDDEIDRQGEGADKEADVESLEAVVLAVVVAVRVCISSKEGIMIAVCFCKEKII